ncbi:MAG: glycosyltransferase [Flavobacteriales bacterium]|nr:glycosyltransferase [Flavobacteriales bacterium]
MSERATGRTIVFLSYWGSDEPLTVSTVLPTLRMLLDQGLATRIVLCTVERSARIPPPFDIPGCVHVQWRARQSGPKALSRALDMKRMHRDLVTLLRSERPQLLVARGVVAGGMAHFAARSTGVPYAVDYVEPHADYMADVGEWRRNGPLYLGLNALIGLQCRSAMRLVTVSHNYRRMLLAKGVPAERVLVAPCPVDVERMRFDPQARREVRALIGADEAPVGIYLGKFGGLYHREKSFAAFTRFLERAGARSRFVVRTPEPPEQVLEGMRAAGADTTRVHVGFAGHAEVPRWLSAADVAFAPYRGTPSSACISPMKIGEYWANGLPVVLTRGVGDDSSIIEQELYAGALFDPEGDDIDQALDRVLQLLSVPEQRERTAELADRYRSMDLTKAAYAAILEALPKA